MDYTLDLSIYIFISSRPSYSVSGKLKYLCFVVVTLSIFMSHQKSISSSKITRVTMGTLPNVYDYQKNEINKTNVLSLPLNRDYILTYFS